LFDTRAGSGGRLKAGEVRPIVVQAAATAATLNITAVDASDDGYLTAWPCDAAQPNASQSNPRRGGVKANLAIVRLDGSGRVCIYSKQPVDLIVDVFGTWGTGAGDVFVPATPQRRLDTRATSAVADGASHTLALPTSTVFRAPTAAFLNLTTVRTASGGTYVTAWSCGAKPDTSNVNSGGAFPVANAAIVSLSATGTTCFYSSTSTDLLVDQFGWLVAEGG
jgi:hypothetical protein